MSLLDVYWPAIWNSGEISIVVPFLNRVDLLNIVVSNDCGQNLENLNFGEVLTNADTNSTGELY